MWAKKLKILFVCLAGCLAVFSTVIPHHHHENGMICWVIDAAESGDTHSSDVPVKILLGTWAMLSDFVIDSLEVSPCFGIYIERLHTFTFLKTLGLRAPPVA